MRMGKFPKMICTLLGVSALLAFAASANATQLMLFNETFDDVTDGFSGSDPRRYGIPTSATFNSDENWYGARFEQPDGGSIAQDVGVQAYGGGGNSTQTGVFEDDAGLMFQVNASMLTDIILKFDWRTFSAGSDDRLRVGYFIGDITAGNSRFTDRAIDLRDDTQGGTNGDFNWGAGWIELASFSPSGSFDTEMFNLSAAAGESEVWIAFWMDGGEGDYAKIDNIMVMGSPSPVPVPGAVWLFGSALLALTGMRRKHS